MSRAYIAHLTWYSGSARLDLREWFPASDARMRQLRKLLALDPEHARAVARECMDCICTLAETTTWRCSYLTNMHSEITQDLAHSTDPREIRLLRIRANQCASSVRRGYRDIKQLRRNAAAIKHWKF